MEKATKERIKKLHQFEKELVLLEQIEALIVWDQYTSMPEKAVNQRADQLGYLAMIECDKYTDTDFEKFLKKLNSPRIFKKLPKLEQTIVQSRIEGIIKRKKLPEGFIEECKRTETQGYNGWLKAREKNDFKIFEPSLKKLLKQAIKNADFLGKDVYDSCLYDYEVGNIRLPLLNVLLEELKHGLIDILANIKNSKKYHSHRGPLKKQSYPIPTQEKLTSHILELMGIDNSRSVIGSTVHPFQTTLSFDDKRIAIAYRPDDFMFGITAAMHEGGHLLYELGFDKRLDNTCLHGAPSMAMHESQSRLWENQVGLGREFWEYFHPILLKSYPSLKKVSFDNLYLTINKVKETPIRLEADELHYCLHIIIRFELEKDLLSGKLKTNKLQEAWADKYEKYIGIRPKHDNEGVLQDSHWSDGSFGYFPTYALGNIYSGMFWHVITNDKQWSARDIAKGNLIPTLEWLKKNIHRHGAVYSVNTLIKKVCKEPVNTVRYLKYLKDKYYALYDL